MRTKSKSNISGNNYHGIAILLVIAAGIVATHCTAQTQPTAAAQQKPFAPEPLPPGWDQIDERLVFLTIRLSSVEASVDAVDKALKSAGYSKALRTEDAEHARKGNEIMDRKGGGPVPWQDFYGRTAQDFYFHPGTAVHGHVISGSLREADIQAQHTDTPVAIDRPPQLDYIYRANSDNQKRAEQAAAELGGKIDKLIERRRSLEAEQSALWSEIAFQAVASRDLSSKPIYRFNLKSTQQDQSADHIAAAQAACDFVRTTNQLMDDAQKGVENDPGSVFHQFSVAVSSARKTLNDRLAEQESLALDLSDNQTKISKVNTVAKRIDELARNLDDSYRLARDGDVAGDDQRKNTFRGQLQDGLLNTADTAVTADQCILDVVKDWKLTPDVKKPSTQASLHIDIPASTQSPQPVVASDKGSTHVDSQTQVPAETRVDRANVKIEWKLENINQYERLKLVNSWQNLQPKTKLSAQRADGMLAFTRQDSPYLITGPLLISRGATLTIEPGVVVLFGPHANIDNQGTIIAISNTAWIVLANAIPTDWHGIPPGALNEGGADPPSNWVGIHTTGSIELQRCLITGAIEGLETDITGKLSATDCIFAANGGTLSCGGGSRGTVRDSLFFRNGVGPFGHGGNSKCDFSKCLLLFNGVGCTANSGNPCSGDNSTFYGNEIAIQASNKRDLVRVTQSNIFTTTGKPLGSRGGKSVVTGNYWGNEVPSSDPKQDTSHSLRSPVNDAMPSLPPCEYLCLDAADGAKTMVDP